MAAAFGWKRLEVDCRDCDGKSQQLFKGTRTTPKKKLTLTLGVLFGEAKAEALSSMIELSTLSRSRPGFGEPRISIWDIVVDACESEDLLLR